MKGNHAAVSAAIFSMILLAGAPPALAQTTALQTEAQQTDALAARHGTSLVQTRMASEFSTFAGSEANAQSLVTGLRTGTAISLGTASTGGTSSTLTFDPPTRPMGYGNVYISLALARHQLASYGITDPTPQQIQAALTGGTITTGSGAASQTITMEGVLNQRADGMGWGQIAQSQGVSLGSVVSGLRSANAGVAAGAAAAAGASTGRAAAGGITTATGSAAPAATTAGAQRGNSAQAPAYGRSIVTGSGASTASGVVTATGAGGAAAAQSGARAGAAGIVTGAGATPAARGGAGAQGQGKGLLR